MTREKGLWGYSQGASRSEGRAPIVEEEEGDAMSDIAQKGESGTGRLSGIVGHHVNGLITLVDCIRTHVWQVHADPENGNSGSYSF